jgi:hypothetical protein
MNYELAKRLKEAGFPQEQRDGTFLRRPWDSTAKGSDDPYSPTLEELIESCPKNVGKATFVLGSANQGQEWVACYFDFATNRGSEFNESGSTPVEAVARLWLALHAAGASASKPAVGVQNRR